jgi:MFS family permease
VFVRTKIRDFAIIFIILAVFFLLFSLAVRVFTDYTISDFLPGQSDPSDYYIEINTAIEYGVFSRNAGYNGFMWEPDTLSVAPTLFYGGHGLFMLVPYIILGKIVGWSGAAPLVIHMILLAIAFCFVYLCTGSIKKTVAMQLLTFSFVPFLMCFSTPMMEVQMYAWAILLTALTYAYLNRPSRRNRFALLVTIVLASFAKITHAAFIGPYLAVTLWQLVVGRAESKPERKQYWQNLYLGMATILASGVSFIVSGKFTAPYNSNVYFHFKLAETWSDSPAEALRLFFEHFIKYTKVYFDPSAAPNDVAVRYFLLGFVIVLLASAFIEWDGNKLKRRFDAVAFGWGLTLFVVAFLNVAIYDVHTNFMITFFFAAIAYTVLDYERFAALAKIGVTLLLVFVIFLDVFLHNAFWGITEHFGPFHTNQYAYHVHYDPDATTRYGNTILVPSSVYGGGRFHDIKAGLGAIGVISSYTPEAMGRLGIKYILRDAGDPLEENEYYEMIFSDDAYILYGLRPSVQ